jgi:hypothetical protein
MVTYKLICVSRNGSYVKIAKGDDALHPAINDELKFPTTVSVTVFADGKPHSVHSDWSNWPKGA